MIEEGNKSLIFYQSRFQKLGNGDGLMVASTLTQSQTQSLKIIGEINKSFSFQILCNHLTTCELHYVTSPPKIKRSSIYNYALFCLYWSNDISQTVDQVKRGRPSFCSLPPLPRSHLAASPPSFSPASPSPLPPLLNNLPTQRTTHGHY